MKRKLNLLKPIKKKKGNNLIRKEQLRKKMSFGDESGLNPTMQTPLNSDQGVGKADKKTFTDSENVLFSDSNETEFEENFNEFDEDPLDALFRDDVNPDVSAESKINTEQSSNKQVILKKIFDQAALREAWKSKPARENEGFRFILKSRPTREIKQADKSLFDELLKLKSDFPNFSDAIEQLEAHLSLNILTESPIKFPVLNLQGEPGIGKTQFTKRVAESLQLEFFNLNIGSMTGKFELVGGHSSYRDATIGEIARLILGKAKTANPIFLLDELCLVKNTSEDNLYHPLYALFDSQQSKQFKENYLGIELDLSNVNFITTTNDFSKLPVAIKSRLTNISINPPNRDQMFSIVDSIYHEILDECELYLHIDTSLTTNVKQLLVNLPPREVKKHLFYAAGMAARRLLKDSFSYRAIIPEDLPASVKLSEQLTHKIITPNPTRLLS